MSDIKHLCPDDCRGPEFSREISQLKAKVSELEKPKLCPACFEVDPGVCSEDFMVLQHMFEAAKHLEERYKEALQSIGNLYPTRKSKIAKIVFEALK